ncbi:MAG TPA: phosphate signaling complex protein PhoU [Bacteroidota bacterium]|nr:phosphate signaling complex protein PhoU [Bacteroidota bacterium]
MERHFQRELESLKTTLVKMGSVVEGNLGDAIQAVLEKNEHLASQVIDKDKRVDDLEIEIDNAVIDLLALQQPMASDLRFILAAQKINNDLERIGDHAVNIAQSGLALCKLADTVTLDEIPRMTGIAKTMLKDALDAFILLDPSKARRVLTSDDEIDNLNREVAKKVIELVKNNTRTIECGLELSRVSRNLERVGDLATNIAEEVIFHTQARVVKHHADEHVGEHEKRKDEAGLGHAGPIEG